MNDSIILIVAILISATIGFYIGTLINKLKSKSERSTLEERQNQLNKTVTDLKKQYFKY